MKLALIGNPNTGKTTLFNSISASSEHTGNWHGVTVDFKEKQFKIKDENFELVDLPGVYSLSPLSFEEKITRDYLANQDVAIINIVDANNLYRNFYLLTEILMLNRPTILVINKTCSEEKLLYKVNKNALQKELGIKVFEVNAENPADVNDLKNEFYKLAKSSTFKNQKNEIFNQKFNKNNEKIENLLKKIEILINFNVKEQNFDKNFVLNKCLENDQFVISKLNLSNFQKEELCKICGQTSAEEIAKNKYNFIGRVLQNSGTKKLNKTYGKSKIDRVVLNKYLSIPIFIIVMLVVFYLTFFSVGKFLSELLLNITVNGLGEFVLGLVKSVTSNQIIYDFFAVAIVQGLGSVFSFLPQVVILFVCLGVLEHSGYLSRLAFMLDDVFARVGLSGKGVYTLLMGFGCSAVACLSARTMEDKNSQIKTAMLAPYMSCSAKLPLYVVLGSAFFGASNVFVILAMYLLGVVVALLLSVFYEKTFLKSGKQTFILEFPPYKIVKLKTIKNIAILNTKQFLVRVGSLLISVNVIVWLLSNFSFAFKYVAIYGGESIMQTIGKFIAPIFAPLGFGSWGASTALVAGLVAKEIIVSSIAMINGVSQNGGYNYLKISSSLTNATNPICFTPASAIAYMVFCLLYSPCFATMAMLKKEIGKKWLLVSVLVQFAVAYVISLIVYSLVNVVINKGILVAIFYLFLFGITLFAFIYIIKHFTNKKCMGCKRCKK